MINKRISGCLKSSKSTIMQKSLSKHYVQQLNSFKSSIFQTEKQNIIHKILHKQANTIEFYNISQQEQKKIKFQTFHSNDSKNNQYGVNQYKKELIMRKKLKKQGHLLLLSQLYQHLGESSGIPVSISQHGDLDSWEKSKKIYQPKIHKIKQLNRTSHIIKYEKDDKQNTKFTLRKFKQGSDYIQAIQKGLQIIAVTHASQLNFINRYNLIENSSKLLKQQLDHTILNVEQEIKRKKQQLEGSRKEHHQRFQQKTQLRQQQKKLLQQLSKDENLTKLGRSHTHISNKIDKIQQFKTQRKVLHDTNQTKIIAIKKNIQNLQNQLLKLQEDHKILTNAENNYYYISLKNGVDCRQSGLGWILKELKKKNNFINLGNLEFPNYLDKKSKNYLISKAQNEQILQSLMEEKRIFISEIGKNRNNDRVIPSIKNIEGDKVFEVPVRYQRSKKKLTILGQQYHRNQSIIEHLDKKNLDFSLDLEGTNSKQIYCKTRQKLKKVDLTKIKRQKSFNNQAKLLRYQNLLSKIRDIHIKLEELDIQQQAHLLSNYKDAKDNFLIVSTACFGSKKAYSLIIKNFSLKNAFAH